MASPARFRVSLALGKPLLSLVFESFGVVTALLLLVSGFCFVLFFGFGFIIS